jgi:hypothetical protein
VAAVPAFTTAPGIKPVAATRPPNLAMNDLRVLVELTGAGQVETQTKVSPLGEVKQKFLSS